MRISLRSMALAGVLATGLLALGTTPAKAQGYGGGYYGGGHGGGGHGGGGHGVPSYSYYGNGGHDFSPHMHSVQTPIGGFSYYGMGAHDFRPHGHTQTPYGITGYNGGFFSNTQSYSPPSPYTYQPW